MARSVNEDMENNIVSTSVPSETEWVKTLLSWYDANKRDLPWRKTKDPYLSHLGIGDYVATNPY